MESIAVFYVAGVIAMGQYSYYQAGKNRGNAMSINL